MCPYLNLFSRLQLVRVINNIPTAKELETKTEFLKYVLYNNYSHFFFRLGSWLLEDFPYKKPDNESQAIMRALSPVLTIRS